MSERIIHTDDDVHEGMMYLCGICPQMRAAYQRTGPLPLRRRPEGFAQLLHAIVGQQVSVASASAIWGRLQGAGVTEAASCRATSMDDLRALGLSRQKAAYAHALAEAQIDFDALRDLPSDQVIKTLVAVQGIGPWTAQIYAMTSLGRADVFAPGDLALQDAARSLYDLPERPKEKMFRQMAESWAPWRSVAARLLWAYYKVEKQRDGMS